MDMFIPRMRSKLKRIINHKTLIKSSEHGVFTANNVKLEETSLNNLVLRVPLSQSNLIPTSDIKCETPVFKSTSSKLLKQAIKKHSDTFISCGVEHKTPILPSTTENVDKRYYLRYKSHRNYSLARKLNYKFKQLLKDTKTALLPDNWIVKIIVRKKIILDVVFLNDANQGRYIKFNAKSGLYDIVIDGKPAALLGSPDTIDTLRDLEILIDIVHNISPQNPMVWYP